MVYQTVFWCIVLSLQSPKQRLLGTQNLHGTRGVFCQTEQTAGVTDEPGTDEVSDQGGQIWRDRSHSIPKVLGELRSVSGNGDDLVAEGVDVIDIRVGYFRTHGYLCGGFDCGFEVFREDRGKVGRGSVGSEAHSSDHLRVCYVVDDYFREFWEMPTIPFLREQE